MRLALVGLFCACGVFAQVTGDNIITSFAGAAWTFPDGVAGKNAPLGAVNRAHLDNDGNVIFADAGAPVKAGDTLTIYCTGLGALDAAVDAATAASATPNVKNPVLVTVGDAKAAVSSGTLVAGYTGMYQARIAVTDGVAAGDGIPVVVSVLGQSSVPVNIAVGQNANA